jgi:hypothetical protein
MLFGLIPSDLICCDFERGSVGAAAGWQGHLVDLDDDGRDEVVFFCPACAAREFGRRGTLPEGRDYNECP